MTRGGAEVRFLGWGGGGSGGRDRTGRDGGRGWDSNRRMSRVARGGDAWILKLVGRRTLPRAPAGVVRCSEREPSGTARGHVQPRSCVN